MSGHVKGFLYRLVMLALHRFDLHYAPEIGPLEPEGDYQLWCKWCGFRMSFVKGPRSPEWWVR